MSDSGDGEKYTVRRRDTGEILPPGTFFVLRPSDMFAYAGLWAYAQTLQTAVEVLALHGHVEDEAVRALDDLRSRVERQAESWQEMGGRLPT